MAKTLWLFYVAFLFSFFGVIDRVESDCLLSLNKDFGDPAPLYLQNGRPLAPNKKDGVSVRHSGTVTIACPGDKIHVVLGNVSQSFSVVDAKCMSGTRFRAGKWEGEFKDIRCNGPPWITSAPSTNKCYGGNMLHKVGYQVENKFHSFYEACFDSNLLSTLYVKHKVAPTVKYRQTGRRPQFIEGGLYGKTRMSKLYKTENQRTRLSNLLGDVKEEYVTKTQFLTRGHLAPRGDFSLRAEQRASFHFVNTAPQWMRGNAGDWAALEDAVRRRAYTLNTTLTIYTGTNGVSTLQNSDGTPTELYLATDANNNYIVPVPLYFYKLVYDANQKTAIAFVLINSSYYNKTITDKLTFCTDACEGDSRYSWLTWRNDGTHSFCCNYEELTEKIKELPPLKVVGEFY